MLDQIEIVLQDGNDQLTVYIDVFDNSLSRKWLKSLNHLIQNNYHLEKNYCFFGFVNTKRNGWFLLDQVNQSISAINSANLGYQINDIFTMENCITNDQVPNRRNPGRNQINERLNLLHRYFEDLQGVSGNMSEFYLRANDHTRWHIRQLNLLCHEFESWALSYKKELDAPEWMRPSQLMCWLKSPRFAIEEEDYELFGIETINRPRGGIFVGVNKAVGKHHWEVFHDEGKDSRVGELTTTTLRGQTEASGDFDIEWAKDPAAYHWQEKTLEDFRTWLIRNNFDPDDKKLTIGHPQVGQVDLVRTFKTDNYKHMWAELEKRLNVYSIKTSQASAIYDYQWDDANYIELQIKALNARHNSE